MSILRVFGLCRLLWEPGQLSGGALPIGPLVYIQRLSLLANKQAISTIYSRLFRHLVFSNTFISTFPSTFFYTRLQIPKEKGKACLSHVLYTTYTRPLPFTSRTAATARTSQQSPCFTRRQRKDSSHRHVSRPHLPSRPSTSFLLPPTPSFSHHQRTQAHLPNQHTSSHYQSSISISNH